MSGLLVVDRSGGQVGRLRWCGTAARWMRRPPLRSVFDPVESGPVSIESSIVEARLIRSYASRVCWRDRSADAEVARFDEGRAWFSARIYAETGTAEHNVLLWGLREMIGTERCGS